jgi:ribonuclease P protein component
MIPKKYRLSKNHEFNAIYKKGHFFSTLLFKIVILRDLRVDKKIGIVVGKNISNKATERNLYKRQIRAIIHQRLKNIKSGNKIIIILKNKPVDYNNLQNELELCLKKSALF